MSNARPVLALLTSIGLIGCAGSVAAAGHDGAWYDPGFEMTAPAEGAPAPLGDASFLLGSWTVRYERWEADSLVEFGDGRSDIGYFNKGHGIVERFACVECAGDDREVRALTFWVYSPRAERWGMGEGDNITERIRVYHGPRAGEPWVFETGVRRRGGIPFTWERVSITRDGDDVVVRSRETSNDGESWRTVERRTLTRAALEPLPDPATPFGAASEDRPAEAAGFDFLIGDWDMAHDMTFPDGRNVNYPSHTTATFQLGGQAVLEFGHVDVDPSLPDAATTIVRMYNRAMRRWESLYMTNRFHGLLHFGGVQEGDRIVLHDFDIGARDTPFSYWIFHSIEEGRYGWYADTTRDGGRTFEKTWVIEATRR